MAETSRSTGAKADTTAGFAVSGAVISAEWLTRYRGANRPRQLRNLTDHVKFVSSANAGAAHRLTPGCAAALDRQAVARGNRHLFDWLVTGQVVPVNPAHSVRGSSNVVKAGKTPVLPAWRRGGPALLCASALTWRRDRLG